MPIVVIADTTPGLQAALEEIFAPHGGVKAVIPRDEGMVYVKLNKLYLVPEHNDLMTNTRYQAKLMGVTPVSMVPLNPLRSAFTLAQARLHGLAARVPPLLG